VRRNVPSVTQKIRFSLSCADAGWNPKLHVAVAADTTRWRVEMAIPFAELSSRAARPRDTWAVRISRTTPNGGRQSWLPPFTGEENSESFGIVQFR
jgi:hypothetical protein